MTSRDKVLHFLNRNVATEPQNGDLQVNKPMSIDAKVSKGIFRANAPEWNGNSCTATNGLFNTQKNCGYDINGGFVHKGPNGLAPQGIGPTHTTIVDLQSGGEYLNQGARAGPNKEIPNGSADCGSRSAANRPFQNAELSKTAPQSIAGGEECRIVTDDLARLLVRCREPSVAVMEDRFDGDPAHYQRFIHQFQDTVLDYYGRTDPAYALLRLAAATKGRARRIVEACQVNKSPTGALQQALQDLKEAFGAPQLQVDAHLRALKEGPMTKFTANGLQDFYVSLLSCRNLLWSVGVEEELDTPATTEGIFHRLSKELQRRFVRFAVDKGYQIRRIPFCEVLSFIKLCRDEANSNFGRLYESMSTGNRINKYQVGQRTKTRFVRANVSLASPADANVKPHSTNIYPGDTKCPCCEETENHGLWKCQKFLGLQAQKRRAIVKEGQYCFSCLKVGHQAKMCPSKFRCKECGLPHNTLLHVTKNPSVEGKREPRETVVGCVTAACKSEVTTMQASVKRSERMLARPRTRLKVLPVRVKNGETSMEKEILAFLDGGADCHLIRKELFEELGLKGEAVQSRIGLANGSTSVENTFTTDLLLSGLDDVEFYELSSAIVTETLADVSASAPCLEDFDRNSRYSEGSGRSYYWAECQDSA